jgi:hypothetical protein
MEDGVSVSSVLFLFLPAAAEFDGEILSSDDVALAPEGEPLLQVLGDAPFLTEDSSRETDPSPSPL